MPKQLERFGWVAKDHTQFDTYDTPVFALFDHLYVLPAGLRTFTLIRGALLEMYGLSKPNSLIAEQRLWRLLASFIRRGEAFYYPAELATDDNRILEGKSQNDDLVA